MKYLKSHFWYNKSQRNGIFFLLVFIIIFQIVYVFVDFSSDDLQSINSDKITAFQKQIDSLKQIETESKMPKIYPFNPNYITDFKGYQLGMTADEIDRLHSFRKQNKWINSVVEFQQVTKVSDSLLNKISHYFKFPDWVVKQNKSKSQKSTAKFSYNKYVDRKLKTVNINEAIAEDFTAISGIGKVLSERIVKYRNRLQGFSYDYQLNEVWGIKKEVVKKVLTIFKITEKPNIKKINVNTASFKEVLKNPYINYKLCKKIFEYRDEVAELKDVSELKRVKDFPLDKYDRIILYLKAE